MSGNQLQVSAEVLVKGVIIILRDTTIDISQPVSPFSNYRKSFLKQEIVISNSFAIEYELCVLPSVTTNDNCSHRICYSVVLTYMMATLRTLCLSLLANIGKYRFPIIK